MQRHNTAHRCVSLELCIPHLQWKPHNILQSCPHQTRNSSVDEIGNQVWTAIMQAGIMLYYTLLRASTLAESHLAQFALGLGLALYSIARAPSVQTAVESRSHYVVQINCANFCYTQCE